MEYNRSYALERLAYHEREADEAKRDLELATAEGSPDIIELFTKRYNEETRFAEAWREAGESLR
jgi:hypothetical protein